MPFSASLPFYADWNMDMIAGCSTILDQEVDIVDSDKYQEEAAVPENCEREFCVLWSSAAGTYPTRNTLQKGRRMRC